MFTPSVTTVSGAVLEIADAAGASADAERTSRAGRSLFAAIKYINGRQNWSWLLTENAPIQVTGPFTANLTAVASGAASASASAGHGVKADDIVVGDGFAVGTRVSATAASAIGFNFATTGNTGSAPVFVRDFYDLPTDWKQPYTVRMIKSINTLYPAPRRAYDRSVPDEFAIGTPQWYDLFAGFQKGKIRLLPPPAQSDTLLLRYYRRMEVPSATGATSVLDIPQDYDFHLIAWAKWHFLVDQSEGRADQASTWLSLANEGIKVMLSDQMRQPDETLAFTSSTSQWNWPGRGSTREINWDYT